MLTKRDLLRSAAFAAVTATAARSVPVLAQDRPGLFKAKDIAEEGFIFGLPIVMNYAVMYEYSVDRNSGQFKAPFNQIKNEARVYTYKDTSIVTPNSDTPYSFFWMDLRAEPMVLSVPAVEKGRYYAVQLEDGNTYNYGYIGSRATVSALALIGLPDCLIAASAPSMRGWMFSAPGVAMKIATSPFGTSVAIRSPIAKPES